MSDYSNLSDDELRQKIAAARGSSAPAAPTPMDYSHLSDDELRQKIDAAKGGDGPTTLQEMHPDFTEADRLVAKNLVTNDQAAVDYLQKRHRNLEVTLDQKSGQIKARKAKSDEPYKVLDPDKGLIGNLNPLSSEFYRDIGDIGYDIASGVGTGVATAAGGLAGGAVGLPAGGVGAIPGALAGGAAAGATSSGALEALRQKLGKAVGVEQDYDLGQIGAATAGGAAAPLLFGTGGKVASKLGGLLGKSTATEAERQILQKAQRGAGGYAWDNVGAPIARGYGAKIGSSLSGVGEDALREVGDNNAEFKKILKDPEGALNFLDETGDVVNQKFFENKTKTAEAFKAALGEGTEPVNVASVKERLKAAIREAEDQTDKRKGTGDSAEYLQDLKEAYAKYFVYDDVEATTKQVMKPSGLLDAAGKPVMTEATEAGEKAVKRELETLAPDAAIELSSELSELANMHGMKSGQVTGTRMGQGMTKAEKKLQQLGGALKHDLDAAIDAVVPEDVMPLRRQYGEFASLQNQVKDLTSNPHQTFMNLRNLDQTSNMTKKQLFHKVDRIAGTDLQKRAAMAEAVTAYAPGKKSFFSKAASFKSIPAGAAGAGAGALIAQQNEESPFVGGFTGGILGSALGGPAAMRRYIQLGLAAKNVSPLLRTAAGGKLLEEKKPWQGMTP